MTTTYSEIKTEERKAQVDIALRVYLDFLNHYHEENDDDVRMSFEDFFLPAEKSGVGHDLEPILERATMMGDFGYMIHLSRVTPYWDEGGPAELIAFFDVDYLTGQPTSTLKTMLQNFDTMTVQIWGIIGYGRDGLMWL